MNSPSDTNAAYEPEITEEAYSVYTVTAASEDEAREKFRRGEWNGWRHVEYGPAEIGGVRRV